MIVLAIDTSFDACSAAICCGGEKLWAERLIIGKGHAEALPPMVARGLKVAHIAPKDLDRVGVVIGPGAFAGVRVGLAFARAFRIGLRAEVVGLTSHEAIAVSLTQGTGLIASVFDARRGQVYAALHDAAFEPLLAPFVASPAHAAEAIMIAASGGHLRLVGSGAGLLTLNGPSTVEPVQHIDPAALARRSAVKPCQPHLPMPLYLRPPDAEPAAASLFAGLDLA